MAGREDDDDHVLSAVKYPCMPTLVSLQHMRNRLKMAYLGRKLMNWTAMATGRELRTIATNIQALYGSYHEDMRDAFLLLARARYFFPLLNRMVLENPGAQACVTVTITTKPHTGVKLLNYDLHESGLEPYEYLGIEKGGQQIHEAKIAWLQLIRRLVKMQEMRIGFLLLEKANRNATKRMNVLNKIVIPRTKTTIQYILLEMQELAREELFRIKIIKKKKVKNPPAEKKEAVCSVCKKAVHIMGVDEGDKSENAEFMPPRAESIGATQAETTATTETTTTTTETTTTDLCTQIDHVISLFRQLKGDMIRNMEEMRSFATSLPPFLIPSPNINTDDGGDSILCDACAQRNPSSCRFGNVQQVEEDRTLLSSHQEEEESENICGTCSQYHGDICEEHLDLEDNNDKDICSICTKYRAHISDSQVHEDECTLCDSSRGGIERIIKKSVTVTHTLNDDGTIREETKTVTISSNVYGHPSSSLMDKEDPTDDNGR